MSSCPCGQPKTYEECCLPIIKSERLAQSAQELMRARYSAYVNTEIDFIMETHLSRPGEKNDRDALESWSKESDWQGLEIISTQKGSEKDSTGIVEFKANYQIDGEAYTHHEKAEFSKIDGKWFFIDGKMVPVQRKRGSPKVGRNDPCPCGSGKKFKKCCA